MKNRLPYPDYDNPPVVEVALAVQFERLPGFRYTHLGLLWQRFADALPHVEDHAQLDQVVETFGVPEGPRLGVQLISGDTPPAVRSWFLNERRTELLQVQPDRLIHNWRKVGAGIQEDEAQPYPRYEHIREQFSGELSAFRNFIDEFQLGEFVPNQCEITYVNHIISGAGWHNHSEIDAIISFFKPSCRHLNVLEMENARLEANYMILAPNQSPIGRLHVSLQPAFRKSDTQQMYVLTLVARGRPDETSSAGIMRFLDYGRHLIVTGFTEFTTPHMHAVWKRTK